MGGLLLKEIEVRHFRNHEKWVTELSPGLTVLVGRNAAGKTNILEAVAVATTGRSFRPFSWSELVREGQGEARVALEGSREGTPFEVLFSIGLTGPREHRLDGKPAHAAAIGRKIPTVSFVPEDLSLSKGPAEERRAALDRIGERLSPAYTKVRREYSRVVKQRNHLLRTGAAQALVDPWSERLAEVGAALVVQRARLLSRMEPDMAAAQKVMGRGESFSMHLSASWVEDELSAEEAAEYGRDEIAAAIEKALREGAEEERKRGFSLIGPHKDDPVFLLEGREARAFASQGQHRTLALAWKAAEVSVVKHVTGYQPILLLDDVMSELDEERRAALSREVIGGAQAIVTTTHLDYFAGETLSDAIVATV